MTSPRSSTSGGDAQRTGRTVVGLFGSRSDAEDAIRDLKAAGFTNEEIGVATQDKTETRRVEREATADRSEPQVDRDEVGTVVEDTATGMAEGASVGAITGGVIGGLVGLLSSLLIPGLGPIMVGGVLASTLMGAGLGAATGGLIGALVGMGVPEEDARYFDAGLRQGGTLVTVAAGDATPEAVSILQRHGADLGPARATVTDRAEELAQSRADRFDRSAPYQGQDRRSRHDLSYTGPERRLVGV
jgi:uncharacterized membrane protein